MPIGILGQVWYLIVSIPDLCTLTYFDLSNTNDMVSTKIYDKWDDFNFEIVNFPFLEGDVPRSPSYGVLVREPVIGLTKWLRHKCLKVCSYGKCAELKNQTLKNIDWYTKLLCATEYPRVCSISNSANMGVPLQVYNLNHVI